MLVIMKNLSVTGPANVHLIGKDILRFHAIIGQYADAVGLPLPGRFLAMVGLCWKGKNVEIKGNVVDPIILVDKYR